jgi:hypothetical protein
VPATRTPPLVTRWYSAPRSAILALIVFSMFALNSP